MLMRGVNFHDCSRLQFQHILLRTFFFYFVRTLTRRLCFRLWDYQKESMFSPSGAVLFHSTGMTSMNNFYQRHKLWTKKSLLFPSLHTLCYMAALQSQIVQCMSVDPGESQTVQCICVEQGESLIVQCVSVDPGELLGTLVQCMSVYPVESQIVQCMTGGNSSYQTKVRTHLCHAVTIFTR